MPDVSKRHRSAPPPEAKPRPVFLEPAPFSPPKKKPRPSTEEEIILDNISYEKQMEILKEILRTRQEALPQHPTAPSKEEITKGIENLSLHMRKETEKLKEIKFLQDQQENPYRQRKLPSHIEPTTLYPSKGNLLKMTKFGKSSNQHSFIVTPDFPQILLPLLKSNLLPEQLISNLREADPRVKFLIDAHAHLKNLDFRILQLPTFQWDRQPTVNKDKMRLRTACLLHYDLDVAAVQRFCGWRYTGEHRRWEELLYWCSYILSEKTYLELWPGYIMGAPRRLLSNEKNTFEHFQRYRKHGNLANVKDQPGLVAKDCNKEDAREISFVYPATLTDFIPHIWLIPLGLALVEGKKPRLYRHATKQIHQDSFPVNRLVNLLNEPEITFGDTLLCHYEYIWRLRATFPTARILSYDDDISGAFNQRLFHPDVSGANCILWGPYLVQSVGLHFGGTFCPASFEPLRRARCEIAEFLFHNCSFQIHLNQEVLDLITTELPPLTAPLAAAVLDNPNERQCHEDGSVKFHYGMYVDDGQTAITDDTPDGVARMITSSVESAYILLGYPGPIQNPLINPTMSWDKMVDRPIKTTRETLGLENNTDLLEVTIPARRLDRLEDCLRRHWNKNRKTFTARAAAQLIGNLLSCLQGCHWLKMATLHLQSALRMALRNNAKRLARSNHFNAILAEKTQAWLEPDAGQRDAKLLGIQSHLARLLWRCDEKTFVPKTVHLECAWLIVIIKEHRHDKSTWTRPISHIVRRKPDWIAFQDASTKWGIGGHSPSLGFYWFLSWENLSPVVAKFINSTLNKGQTTDAHINWLEFIAIVINYAAVIICACLPEFHLPYPPKVKFVGDNTTANRVANKGTLRSDSEMARAAARVLSSMQRPSKIGLDTEHIEGLQNTFADDLSRGVSAHECTTKMSTMSTHQLLAYTRFQTPDQWTSTMSYQRFLPSPSLLSAITTAVLNPNRIELSQIANLSDLGHLSEDSSTFITFSPVLCGSKTSP
jgi:hypothetical protein